MRLEVVMGLLSSFQIYHQCMSNVLSLLDFGYTPLQLSTVSDYAAGLLICGSVFMLMPFMLFLCFARFIIGLGVGIAFVSAFVALNDNNLFNSPSRSQAFLGTAALFSVATFMVNASVYFRSMSYLMLVTIFAVPSLMAGLNYFWHRSEYCEPDYSTLEARKKEYEDFQSPGNPCAEQAAMSQKGLVPKCRPKLLAIVLMTINATIGVPVVLAFCSIIYQSVGLSQTASIHLSSLYPLLQLGAILSLRHWSSAGKHLSSRDLLLGGYALCLLAMFLLLVTLHFHTLDCQPTSKAVASAFWFSVLAVASGVPCNAGVCLISDIFNSKKELVEGSSISRAFFWIISSILSGTFLLITQHHSLFLAFAPCFAASLIAYIALVFILPENKKASMEDTKNNACQMDALLARPYAANANRDDEKFTYQERMYTNNRDLNGANEGKISAICDQRVIGCKG